jgi:hypothetical protein
MKKLAAIRIKVEKLKFQLKILERVVLPVSYPQTIEFISFDTRYLG